MAVKIIKSERTGKLLTVSSFTAEEAWIRVIDMENHNVGFINGFFEELRDFDVVKAFKEWTAEGIDCGKIPILQPKGLAEGQILPGRVVIQDSLKPVMKNNPGFCKFIPNCIPGSRYFNYIIYEKCKLSGISYKVGDKIIYRREFYSPYPKGHTKFEVDIYISPDNLDEVNSFINEILS
jgi:hypothetical protein